MRTDGNNPVWGEAEWEKEIRRDEGRINRYFHDLPVCIDLPDEEDFIFADISSIPELIPGNTSSEEWKKLRRFEDDPDAECDCHENSVNHDDECVRILDRLGVEWSVLSVDKLDNSLWMHAAGVTCSFAKLISSVENYNAADKNAELALKKILGKKMLRDLDMLVKHLRCVSAIQTSLFQDISMLISSLARLRVLLAIRCEEL